MRQVTARLHQAVSLMLSLVAGALFSNSAAGQSQMTNNGPFLIRLPADVRRGDLGNATEALRRRLHAHTKQAMNVANDLVDAVVLFADPTGQAILPDHEAALVGASAGVQQQKRASPDLSFTFDSSEYPWTAAELNVLSTSVGLFYPIVTDVYGPPAFRITINIRKDPTIAFAGLYYPSVNEIVLPSADRLEVLCHELIHAFRDDNVISLSSFEEGMTRAAEVEVFARLGLNDPEGHDYTYDVFYEALNLPMIGARGGVLNRGYVSLLLRYQLAGYAWAKALIEDARFFERFNAALYAEVNAGNRVLDNEAALVSLAAAARSTVERKPFLTWYGEQHVLNTNPPTGCFLYQRISTFTVDYFCRNSSGTETMQQYADILWQVYDASGELISAGMATTTANGWSDFIPSVPASYSGRLMVVASAASPAGEVVATSYTIAGVTAGVFGVVPEHTMGTLTVRGAGSGRPVSVAVVNGAFSLPTLGDRRGQFIAEFESPSGVRLSRIFTKDASPYFLEIR